MKFQQIVVLDYLTFTPESLEALSGLCEGEIKVYEDDPKDVNSVISRIGEADCVLTSWRSEINSEVIEACSNLKYIGVCATSVTKVDLSACSKKGIVVTNVRDYGDEGVVEWIFYELLCLIRGLGKYQWKSDKVNELAGKTFGIIGLGVLGKMVAKAALGFNMNVVYYSRTRNNEFENKGCKYLPKKELLKLSDFISLQIPRDLKILDKSDFDLMKEKVLINNVIGEAFLKKDFLQWGSKENNFAIMDRSPSIDFFDSFLGVDRVIMRDLISGRTEECFTRLSNKSIENIKAYLSSKVINQVK